MPIYVIESPAARKARAMHVYPDLIGPRMAMLRGSGYEPVRIELGHAQLGMLELAFGDVLKFYREHTGLERIWGMVVERYALDDHLRVVGRDREGKCRWA
jgi:hypothetical protein